MASEITAGEAGIVLRRDFDPTPAVLSDEDDKGLVRTVEDVVVRAAGVAGVLRVPDGLVTEARAVTTGVFLTGVAVAVLDAADLSAVEGANDTLLGRADIPSLFLSSAPSTELTDVRLTCVGVVVDPGVLTVGIPGRAGGLPKAEVGEGLVVEVVVGLASPEVRGATGFVNGRLGGTAALMLDRLVVSFVGVDVLSAILVDSARNEQVVQFPSQEYRTTRYIVGIEKEAGKNRGS